MLKLWSLAACAMLLACETTQDWRSDDLTEEPNPASVEEAVNGPDAKELDPDAVIPSEADGPVESYTLDGPGPEPTTADALGADADIKNEVGEAPAAAGSSVPQVAGESDIFTVTGKSVSVRSTPSSKGKVVRSLKDGETVKVLSSDKGWAKIGPDEYVSMKSLKK